MKRRLFTILSALSLLLFAVVVVLWVRSHQVTDYLMRRPTPDSGSDWLFLNAPGSVAVIRSQWQHGKLPPGIAPEWTWLVWPEPDWGITRVNGASDEWVLMGIVLQTRYTTDSTWHRLVVSHWLLALMALALPVFWFVRARRKRADHRASDQKPCSSCSYDLRATPERCPECGRVSAKAGS